MSAIIVKDVKMQTLQPNKNSRHTLSLNVSKTTSHFISLLHSYPWVSISVCLCILKICFSESNTSFQKISHQKPSKFPLLLFQEILQSLWHSSEPIYRYMIVKSVDTVPLPCLSSFFFYSEDWSTICCHWFCLKTWLNTCLK